MLDRTYIIEPLGHILNIKKCKDDPERESYIRMTRKFGWSKNVLIHQIENQTYEKSVLSQSIFDETVPAGILKMELGVNGIGCQILISD